MLGEVIGDTEEAVDLESTLANTDDLIPTSYHPKPLREVISDAGTYSYAAIFSNALYDLFNEDCNREFCHESLQHLIQHVGLPEQVESVMTLIMTGQHPVEVEPFIKLLLDETALQGSGLLVLQDLVLFAVQRGVYDARMRVLIHYIAWRLRVSADLVELYEESVVDFLTEEAREQTEEEEKESKRRQRNRKIKRYFMIGLATVGGGALLGLTGGLAAPFMAAGAGAIIGGAGAAVLGSTAGIAVIGSLFGVAGAGLTGFKMKKRVGAVEEFAFDFLTEGRQLHVTIAVTGWLTEEGPEFFKLPWKNMLNSREQYCLRYESRYLQELGQAMDYLFSFAVSMAAQEALKYTILSGIITAIAWPASLLTLASAIDNPWSVCVRRSAEVGKLLAEVLLSRQQGQRPVTLIGFSLGARVIFYCLQELVNRKGCEGIIEDVILLGAPVSGNPKDWSPFARIVSGKIINGYCRGDWLLKFLYRTSSVSLNIAGLQPIKWDNRRMYNIDLSDVVAGHMDYSKKMDLILKTIGIRTCDDAVAVDSNIRKSNSDTPLRKGNGLTGLTASKSELALNEPPTIADFAMKPKPKAASSIADSGISELCRTTTELSLSERSSPRRLNADESMSLGRGSLSDLTLSQSSLVSSVASEECEADKRRRLLPFLPQTSNASKPEKNVYR